MRSNAGFISSASKEQLQKAVDKVGNGAAAVRKELEAWRRSANRTRLQANSPLTGNLTGKFTI